MTEATPPAGKAIEPRPGHESEGKPAALIAWGLYILSLPSANLLVIVGLIVAYAARGGSSGLARAHLDTQISLFWSVFWWTILLWVVIWICIGVVATAPLAGVAAVPIAIVAGLGLLLLTVWFTIKSILGLINLVGDKAP